MIDGGHWRRLIEFHCWVYGDTAKSGLSQRGLEQRSSEKNCYVDAGQQKRKLLVRAQAWTKGTSSSNCVSMVPKLSVSIRLNCVSGCGKRWRGCTVSTGKKRSLDVKNLKRCLDAELHMVGYCILRGSCSLLRVLVNRLCLPLPTEVTVAY